MNKKELKFRVWIKSLKRFGITSNLYVSADGNKIAGSETMDSVATKYYSLPIDDYLIQQSTGLKDKNGREIYEGDILSEHWKHDDSNHISIVKFGIFQNNANEIYGNGYYLDYPRESYMSGRPLISSGYKIIGNIFENSELLK